MTILFVILIILASVVLGLIVLIQNPKGGGLSGSFGGFSNQLMGVKQTTDVLEKGTWIFAGLVGALCLFLLSLLLHRVNYRLTQYPSTPLINSYNSIIFVHPVAKTGFFI